MKLSGTPNVRDSLQNTGGGPEIAQLRKMKVLFDVSQLLTGAGRVLDEINEACSSGKLQRAARVIMRIL
jgi:hypothetical protein